MKIGLRKNWQLHLTLSSRPECFMGLWPTQGDENRWRIHLWSPTLRTEQHRAKDGAPVIGGGFGSLLETDLGAPSLRCKGGRPQPLAEQASQDDFRRAKRSGEICGFPHLAQRTRQIWALGGQVRQKQIPFGNDRQKRRAKANNNLRRAAQ
jgi:hypothetical protein